MEQWNRVKEREREEKIEIEIDRERGRETDRERERDGECVWLNGGLGEIVETEEDKNYDQKQKLKKNILKVRGAVR